MFRIGLLCVTYIISLSLDCVLVCDIYHFTIWHERPARYLTNSRLEITRWTCFGTQTHNSHILIKWKPHTATFTTLNPSQIRRPQNGSTTQKNAKWSIQLGSNRNMFLLKSSCGTFQTHNLSKLYLPRCQREEFFKQDFNHTCAAQFVSTLDIGFSKSGRFNPIYGH